jgi:hypothetical protein
MRKIYLITLLSLLANLSFGQQKIRVHNAGNTMYAKELSSIDSIKLNNTYAKFKLISFTTEPTTPLSSIRMQLQA